jgi:hypothetical protein
MLIFRLFIILLLLTGKGYVELYLNGGLSYSGANILRYDFLYSIEKPEGKKLAVRYDCDKIRKTKEGFRIINNGDMLNFLVVTIEYNTTENVCNSEGCCHIYNRILMEI